MWLPNEGWTGVFHANGSGGYAGYAGLQLRGDGKRAQAGIRDCRSPTWEPLRATSLVRRRCSSCSRQMEGLGNAGDPRGGGDRQADRQGVLWLRIPSAPIIPGVRPAVSRGSSRRNTIPRISTAFSPASPSSTGRGATRSPSRLSSRKPQAGPQALGRQARVVDQIGRGRVRRQKQWAEVGSIHCGPDGLRLRSLLPDLQGRSGGQFLTPEEVETAKAIYLGPTDKTESRFSTAGFPEARPAASIGVSSKRRATPRRTGV